jgi:hypothetical protein
MATFEQKNESFDKKWKLWQITNERVLTRNG